MSNNVIPSDYKNTLENIIIEDGIEEIPNSFCDGCSKLKNINFLYFLKNKL